jgi:hypothetical protein
MSFTSIPPRRRIARRPAQQLPVYVFIAYADLAAAREAIERMNQMLGRSAPDRAVQPMLWRCDQLGQARWREMALHDALRAHAIVLAMGDAPTLDSGTEEWLTMLANRRAGAPTSCLVLMSDGEAWTVSLQRSETILTPPNHGRTNGSAPGRPPPAPRPSCRSLH